MAYTIKGFSHKQDFWRWQLLALIQGLNVVSASVSEVVFACPYNQKETVAPQHHIRFLGKKGRQSKDSTANHVSYQKKKSSLLPTHMHRLPLMSQWPELITWTLLASRKSGWMRDCIIAIDLDQSWSNVCGWAYCCHKQNFHLVSTGVSGLGNKYIGCLTKFDFLTNNKCIFLTLTM